MATSSAVFSGSSRYSSDFASVIQRSVNIASLPLTQMQQQLSLMNDRGAALDSLNSKLSAVQSSLTSLDTAFGVNSLQVATTDSAIRPSVLEGASQGTYSVGVTDLGALTTYVVSGFPSASDPNSGNYTSASGPLSLVIDNDPSDADPAPVTVSLSPASRTVQALADEINAKAGSSVRAAVVNIGSTSSPNYQLSIQSLKYGAVDITLNDGAVSSGNTVAQRGSAVQYTVNGAHVESDSRTVTLAPHVNVDLVKQTTTDATLTIKQGNTSAKALLSNFIAAYNDVITEVDAHRGTKNDALAGDSLLTTITGSLRNLVTNDLGTGAISSLTQLGVEFDKSGKLTLNSTTFDSVTSGNLSDLQTFLGSSTKSGWLKAAADGLNSYEDTNNGVLTRMIQINKESITDENTRIAAQQDRIDRLQNDLTQQMSAADASIAALEQQVTFMTNLFAAMKTDSESYTK